MAINRKRKSASPDPSDNALPQKRVTLRDIAEAVGVTAMTVSRAMRNQSRISEAMRVKIQAKAQQMGYQPDPALTALVHYRHSRMEAPVRAALAWLNFWPDPAKWRAYREFTAYWEGAQAAANRLGFHLEEFVVNAEMTPKRLAKILYTRNVRGVIIPPGSYPEEWVDAFPWDQFSMVGIGRSTRPWHMITSDQSSNAMLAVQKIQERGYRRIGYAGDGWISRTYGAGFLWAQLGSIPEDQRVPPLFSDNHDKEGFRVKLAKWIRENKPDAILTDNPFMPKMLDGMGIRVPLDVGLAAMTTLDCPIDAGIFQNPEEVGRVAVLVLHSLINDNDRGMPAINRQILIEGAWVDGSTLPKRK